MDFIDCGGSHELVCARDLLVRFDQVGQPEILEEAKRQCLSALDRWDPHLADEGRQWKLLHGLALALRFDEFGVQEDFDQAEQLFTPLIAGASAEDPEDAAALYGMGRLFEASEMCSASKLDLDRAVVYYQRALESIKGRVVFTDGTADLRLHLALAMSRRLYYTSAQLEDFIEPYQLLEDARRGMNDYHAYQPYASYVLSSILFRRYWQCGRSRSDLEGSKDACSQAILSAPTHRLRYRFVYNQGGVLVTLHNDCGESVELLHEGIAMYEEAVDLRESRGPEDTWRHRSLLLLGRSYIDRFLSLGDLNDLNRAVNTFRSMNQSLQPTCLVNLCAALSHRYQETGRREDLDDAILLAHRVIEESMPDTMPYTFGLFNLGQALALRFASERTLKDFVDASMYLQAALQEMKAGATMYESMRNWSHGLLMKMYKAKFEASHDARDIDAAVQHARAAASFLSEGHVDTASDLSQLAECLTLRRQGGRRQGDLAEALLKHEQALQLSSVDYSERPMLLWRYAHTLRLRFEDSRETGDLDMAISFLQDVINMERTAHDPRRSLYLTELASCVSARAEALDEAGQLDEVLELYSAAADGAEGYIRDRFEAAMRGARLAQSKGEYSRGTTLYSVAVSLLPRIAWLGHPAELRHAELASVASNLSTDAAACALAANLLERSVELLDEGRAVFWQSILEVRSDLHELEAAEPGLAEELRGVGQTLEYGGEWTESSEGHVERLFQRRRRLAERWVALIETVRQVDGFESFLKPRPFSALRQAAKDGPIVVLNISTFRSDALLVTVDEPIKAVPLSGLDFSAVNGLAQVLSRALHVARDVTGSRFINHVVNKVLTRLWHGGMADVAAALMGLRQVRTQKSTPRVWWIPTGPMNILPVHFAGPLDYAVPGIFDLFTSSYTTTMSALLAARTPRGSKSTPLAFQMLAVSVPSASSLPTLPSAHEEMAVIRHLPFAESIKVMDDEAATIEAVTTAIPFFNWLHLCCHGTFSTENPLSNAFHLSDGPLSLERIIQMRLENAEFAFLSACHTATYTDVLPDEWTNLAAGLQVAGFSGIVASKWAMADKDGPVLAERFYRWLSIDGQNPDATLAAEALHKAIASMRKAGIPVYRCATFIHIGV